MSDMTPERLAEIKARRTMRCAVVGDAKRFLANGTAVPSDVHVASMDEDLAALIAALESAWAEVERLKAGKLAELCREISDFSEESYCAGWMGGIEDDLPRLCAKVIETGRPHHYGQATVTVERAKYFTQLAADAGSWVDMDGNRYEPKVKL